MECWYNNYNNSDMLYSIDKLNEIEKFCGMLTTIC